MRLIKRYVDASKMGLDVKESVKVATTIHLSGDTDPSHNTLTNTYFPRGELMIDGLSGFTIGTRVLVKDQIDKSQNGIYVVTSPGSLTTGY